VPCIRSGSFSDIGPRTYMEDEHICIDDLSSHLGSSFKFPKPSAFYGVMNSRDLKFDSCAAFLCKTD
jgi:protein phosphatase 2C family protein 2/3